MSPLSPSSSCPMTTPFKSFTFIVRTGGPLETRFTLIAFSLFCYAGGEVLLVSPPASALASASDLAQRDVFRHSKSDGITIRPIGEHESRELDQALLLQPIRIDDQLEAASPHSIYQSREDAENQSVTIAA